MAESGYTAHLRGHVFDNREIRMGQIRERVKRTGTRDISRVAEDRRFLLEEVDRLASLMAGVEHEANRLVESQLSFLRNRNEELRTRTTGLEAELRGAKEDTRVARGALEELHREYSELTGSVHKVINGSRLSLNDQTALQAAMASHVKDLDEQVQRRTTDALTDAMKMRQERDQALGEAEKERDIRRRVHERFKRVRREAIMAAETIRSLKHERDEARRLLRVEQDFGLGARKFAALAYRALESERSEDEPTWP